ncbi:hypothetical protein M2163_000538 [Streptomyces sp. SAI-135]|nr:hypothetical protein [Streptomyces sp. SAI-090]MDH6554576.1 hypothetical protein [Streptomyces sp. SAI-041]MDH6581426.1 hypothetical protein [Streptomyces sp. SAI-133]MDH6613430.1 hypothetical protein [Streptomyces sp. SAI-135]
MPTEEEFQAATRAALLGGFALPSRPAPSAGGGRQRSF